MRNDFMLAINQLCAERKLAPEVVLEAVEASLISAYKRNFGSAANIEVRIEPNSGDVRVFAAKEVVETVQDGNTQISLRDARRADPEATVGGTVLIESTPRDFGRIAAQAAKQVILQRIREAERDAQYATFADSAGELAHGTIQSIDYHSGDVIVNLDGAEALLPAREQVPSERYRRGMRLRSYVLDVRRGNRGPQITLSRRSPALLRRLLELEVPEIFNGSVEIKGIAREAGSRSKVAVHATQTGVDPVGSCVGVRGGRIQNVVNELGGEKIDVVQWDPEVETFIGNALSPAKVMNVLLDESPEGGRTATVIVPDRQLSLAIGKEGQNARLAAKLTGWRIDIKSATEAAEETLGHFEEPTIPPEEMDLLALAEALLHQRDMTDLTEAEQAALADEVRKGSEEGLSWPGEEPVLPVEPKDEAQVGGKQEVAADALVAEMEETGIEAEPPLAETVVEAAATEEEAALPAPMDLIDETDLEPTFEGEPIADSIGWVVTEPEEEFYTGWGEPEEEVEELEAEFNLEEFEEEEVPRPGKKKKRKRGKQNLFYNSSVKMNRWRKKKPSRSRGR